MPIAKDNAPSIRDLASESFFRCVNWVNRVNLFKKRERIEILKIFDKLAPKKILDFGCRDGFLSSIIQEHTQAEVYGTDIDMEALDRGARDYPNVKFVLPSAVETMNPEFDVIFMGHVLWNTSKAARRCWVPSVRSWLFEVSSLLPSPKSG